MEGHGFSPSRKRVREVDTFKGPPFCSQMHPLWGSVFGLIHSAGEDVHRTCHKQRSNRTVAQLK